MLTIHLFGQSDTLDRAKFLKKLSNILLGGFESHISNDQFRQFGRKVKLLLLSSIHILLDCLFRDAQL